MNERLERIAERKYPIDELRDCQLTRRRKMEKRRLLIQRLTNELLHIQDKDSKINQWESESITA